MRERDCHRESRQLCARSRYDRRHRRRQVEDDDDENEKLALNIIYIDWIWSLLQFKGYIYLNLSFISNLRVLSTPPGPFQALNPKEW